MINFDGFREVYLDEEILFDEWPIPLVKKAKNHQIVLKYKTQPNICSLSEQTLSKIFEYIPPKFMNGTLTRVNHAFNTAIELLWKEESYCQKATKSLFLEEFMLKSNQQNWRKFYKILRYTQRNIFENRWINQLWIETGLSGCFPALSDDGLFFLKDQHSNYIRCMINIKNLTERYSFPASSNVLGVFDRFIFQKNYDSVSISSLSNSSPDRDCQRSSRRISKHHKFIIVYGKNELRTWEIRESEMVNSQTFITAPDTPYVIRNKRIAFKRSREKLLVLNLKGYKINFFTGPAIKEEKGKGLQGLFYEPAIWDISSDDKLVVRYEWPDHLKNEQQFNEVRVWDLNNAEILYSFNFVSFELEKQTISLKIVNKIIHTIWKSKNNFNPRFTKWELKTGKYLGEDEDEGIVRDSDSTLEKAQTLMMSLKYYPREEDEYRFILLEIINYTSQEWTKELNG